jgi:glycosyltransferase involved in cell wall biosynthesis
MAEDAATRLVLLAGRLGPEEARRVRDLADRLRGPDLAVEVLSVATGGPAEGCGMVACPGLASRWWRPWAVRELVRDGRPPRPALLHVLQAEMDAAGLALAESWQVPYVQAVDDYLPPGGTLRLSRRWCRALVAAGAGLADDLARHLGVPRSWITVVPPGIAPASSCDPAAEHDPGQVAVIGTVGPLAPGSGLATFLQAARQVLAAGVAAEFVVSGVGPAEADVRRLAERLGIAGRVTFAGELRPEPMFWGVLDVYCQATLRPSAGRALAAALAHGVPSIAADVEGLRAWISPGRTGLLVPPGDPDALAGAILDLLADRDRARRLGRAGRDRIAREFDPAREAADLRSVYRRILAAEADAPAPAVAAAGHA